MIIDAHSHIAYSKLYPEFYISGMMKKGNVEVNKKQLLRLLGILLKDHDCRKLVKQMDAAGIAKSVLLIIDGGIGMEESECSLEEIYNCHYQILKRYPSRFIVFAGIDPRRGQKGLELFKKTVNEYGFKGLKLYPPMGYSVGDRRLEPYYEICSRRNLPILIHTGPSLPNLNDELADPKYIEPIAKRYPDIDFILAHAGFNLNQPLIQQLITLSNVYLDISGFQSKFKQVDTQMINSLEPIFQKGINKKILFGTDWPLFNLMTPLSDHVDLIKQLFIEVRSNECDEALENIMYRNATKVLSL